MVASKYGYAETINFLIDAGAVISIKNEKGNTALMIATEKGYKEVMKLLKEAEKTN